MEIVLVSQGLWWWALKLGWGDGSIQCVSGTIGLVQRPTIVRSGNETSNKTLDRLAITKRSPGCTWGATSRGVSAGTLNLVGDSPRR